VIAPARALWSNGVYAMAMRRGPGVVLVLAMLAALPAQAAATPVSGPHETLDNQLTTTQPGTPSGFAFDGRYHAAGDPSAPPPYMRGMTFYPPAGLRYDTGVPDQCTASDAELAVLGAQACPAGSRLGGGSSQTSFNGGAPTTVDLDLLNNAGEQIILARSPILATVSRGRIQPDGSIEWHSPTCYPSLAGCPVDDVLQLVSSMRVAAYTRTQDGVTRSYLTTPPTCPSSGSWDTPVRLWWDDGTVDTVTTRAPCAAP